MLPRNNSMQRRSFPGITTNSFLSDITNLNLKESDIFDGEFPKNTADFFLHSSVVGINCVPKFEGALSRTETDEHPNWPSQDYLDSVTQSRVRRYNNNKTDPIPSLFDKCIRCIQRNPHLFGSKDLISLPHTLQDILLEVFLCNSPHLKNWEKENCLDLFLSVDTSRLNLPVCTAVTDVTIRRIAQRCPNLRELSLAGFVHLTDDCLEQLSLYCPDLKILDLSFCYKITDEGVSFIAQGCPKLRKLVLHQCTKVTSKGIINICKYLHRLRNLDLTGTRYCENSLFTVLRQCDELEYLILYGTPIPRRKLAEMFVDNPFFDAEDQFVDDYSFENPRAILIHSLEDQLEQKQGENKSVSKPQNRPKTLRVR